MSSDVASIPAMADGSVLVSLTICVWRVTVQPMEILDLVIG